ncbi:DNA excision repair protein ERCC-8-like [Amphiura filiformis]|uniref:DNA excision repair protein ERCC-8-like n=1 Tax=Amphiura filiformis TaxID=82378 RepID=UPI003B223923
MLKFLNARERGTHKPDALPRAEVTRRTFSLELSKTKDVQRIHMNGVNTLDIDPTEGRYLLSGGADGVMCVYDTECKPYTKEFTCQTICTVGRSNRNVHKKSVETVQWYPHDTGMFTSSSMDMKLKIWDTNALVPADVFDFEKPIYNHDMSPIATRHTLIAVGDLSHHITLCDLKSGSSTHILKGHKAAVMSVKWSTKDEFLLASGSRDSRVLLWDIRQAKGSLMTLDQHNGETVGSTSAAVHTAHNGHVNGLSFTEDGLHLVSFGTDDRLRLWETTSGKNTLINFGKCTNEGRKTLKLAVSIGSQPDAVFVPSVGDIAVYDLQNGELVYDLNGHYNAVNCCIYHPLYQELYSGGNDSNILIWEPEQMRIIEEDEEEKRQKKTKKFYGQNITATADTWSSDEDD